MLLVAAVACGKRSFENDPYIAPMEDYSCDKPNIYGQDCSGDHNEDYDNLNNAGSSDTYNRGRTKSVPNFTESSNPSSYPQSEPANSDKQAGSSNASPSIRSLSADDFRRGDEVVFLIKPGTGGGSWNSPSSTVKLKRGQKLRLVNMDSVKHQLHTNGAPFEHGGVLAAYQPPLGLVAAPKPEHYTQAVYTCKTPQKLSQGRAQNWDHFAGRGASFYLECSN